MRRLHFTIALWIALVGSFAVAGADRPNVLFISVDDMNDWVGALGYPGVETPNIDRLARKGLLFTNAHAPSPKCNPSRTAILSGLGPATTGIYDNSEWWKPNYPEMVTLPRYFKEHGYYVAGGGKVFHHMPGFNPPESWNEYFQLVTDLRSSGFLIPFRQPRHRTSFDWGPVDKDDFEMGDGHTVRWAVEFLKRKHSRPFFLAVGLFQPHLPFYAPRHYFARYPLGSVRVPLDKPGDLDDVPAAGRKMARFRTDDLELIQKHHGMPHIVQSYLACISHADSLVGVLMDALEAAGCADHTIIVFWSDHGYHFGEKHHFAKNTLWERSSHVPFIWVVPGVTRRGTRSSRPVSLIDIYPTLIELCGLPPKHDLEGVSLKPLLQEPARRWDRPAVMTFQRGNHAVRSERWRYIRYADGAEELYDHRRDPNEWNNLAGQAEFEPVKRQLAKWLPKTNAPKARKKSAFIFDEKTYTWRLKK